MRSNHDETFECTFDAHISSSITSTIPAAHIDMSAYHYLKNIPLADPSFRFNEGIDMLIGADILGTLLLGDTISGGLNLVG